MHRKTWIAALAIMTAMLLGVWAEMRVAGRISQGVASNPACTLFFNRENLCASVTWTKKPVKVDAPTAKDESEFALQFWKDAHGSSDSKVFADPPGKVVVSLWMPAMGHGSLPPEISRDPASKGTYHVRNVLFSMGGDWEIWVTLLADSQLIEKSKLVYRLE